MTAEGTAGGGKLVTLHEAAERLGVHYMTVYRRVRLGMLPAHKVGGSWRIDPTDLAAAQSAGARTSAPASGTSVRSATASKPRRWAPWAERLGQRMLAGDRAGSWQVVEAAMASGVEPQDVYVDILGPALHRIGASWERGEIGIDQEHLASGVATSIVGRLGPSSVAGAGTAARSCWRCPSASVMASASRCSATSSPRLATRSSTGNRHAAGVLDRCDRGTRRPERHRHQRRRRHASGRRCAAGRRRAAHHPTVPIVAGGFAVPDQATARRLGADGWVADPRRPAALIAELNAR